MSGKDRQRRDKRTVKIMIIAIVTFIAVLILLAVASVFIYFKFFATDNDIDSGTQPTVLEARLADMVFEEGTCFGEDVPKKQEGFYRINKEYNDVQQGIVSTNVFNVNEHEQLGIVSRYTKDGKVPALSTQIYKYYERTKNLKVLRTKEKYKNEMWPFKLSNFNSAYVRVYKFECKGNFYIVEDATTSKGANGISYSHKIWEIKGNELVEVLDLQFNTGIVAARRVGSYKLNGKELETKKFSDATNFLTEKYDSTKEADTTAESMLNDYYYSCKKEINKTLAKYGITYGSKDGDKDGGYEFAYLEGRYKLISKLEYKSEGQKSQLYIVSNNLHLVPSNKVTKYKSIKDNFDSKLNKMRNSARAEFKKLLSKDISADFGIQHVIERKNGEASDKSVVVYDLNDDGIEEMFYCSTRGRSDASYSIIYAFYNKDKSILISIPLNDCLTVSGNKELSSAFAVYMSKAEKNTFYIAAATPSNGGDFGNFSIVKYKVNVDGSIEQMYKLENDFKKDVKDDYYINDSKVSAKEGANEFAKVSGDAGQLLMYSGDSRIIPVFDSFRQDDDKAVSYKDAIKNL